MSLPSSGAISIGNIRSELGTSSGSLRSLSASAGKGTPDSMSEFYGYSATPATVYYYNDESSYGGDANLRIYAWDAAGNNVISEFWLWGTASGNLGSATGVTLRQGYTVQVYAINWGASLQRIHVLKNSVTIYDSCAWSEVGPFTFTLTGGDLFEILCVSNNCGGIEI